MAEGVPKYIAVRDNLRQRAQAMIQANNCRPSRSSVTSMG